MSFDVDIRKRVRSDGREFSLEVWCDPKLCGVPEAIHLTGEVLSELG